MTRDTTRLLEAADAAEEFSCGVPELDDYFRRHAWPNQSLGIGRTYVIARAEAPRIAGFYTISMAQVKGASLPGDAQQGKLPSYPLPVALLGRLAVDTRAQGQGLAKVLLGHALHGVARAADWIGCFGVIVDAKDERVLGMYQKFGFILLKGQDRHPKRLFMPMTTLWQTIASLQP